ncbi:MAG: hypothetical protein EBX47_10960 [Synechococcaceae bacterium WB8_1B_057]|nr:hypothetical protein [Synechococcaceae bacterium WB8_1B_057]
MIYKTPCFDKPYFLGRLESHLEIKNNILLGIDLMPQISCNKADKGRISKCDFDIDRSITRTYLEEFDKFIFDYMDKLTESAGYTSWKIHNIWFQQYHKNDFHDWHTHNDCQFANIYYLEYDKNLATTELIHPFTKEILFVEAEEGDILSFPSYIIHRAPPVKTDSRKTILSFNSCFIL